MSTRGKVLGVIAVLAACILVAFLATRDASNSLAKRMVKAEMARLKAAGEPTALEDLMPTGLPSSQNAAEVWAKVFKLMDAQAKPGRLSFTVPRSIWRAGLGSTPTVQEWSAAAEMCAQYDPVVPLVKQAVSRPHCRFPIDWTSHPSTRDLAGAPAEGRIRDIQFLFELRALLAWNRRDIRTRLREIEMGLLASKALGEEPTLEFNFPHRRLMWLPTYRLQRQLSAVDISEEDARRLYDALSSMDYYRSFDAALKGQRVLDITLMEAARARPDKYRGRRPFGATRTGGLYKYTWVDELAYLLYINKLIECDSLPYREIANSNLKSTAFLDSILPPVRRYIFWRAAPRHPAVDAAAQGLYSSLAARDASTALVDGSRIYLALKAFKSRYGEYPKDLNELRVKLGWDIPLDIFSGNDFIYSRVGAGFKFYSIDSDLKDNRGRIDSSMGTRASDTIWEAAR